MWRISDMWRILDFLLYIFAPFYIFEPYPAITKTRPNQASSWTGHTVLCSCKKSFLNFASWPCPFDSKRDVTPWLCMFTNELSHTVIPPSPPHPPSTCEVCVLAKICSRGQHGAVWTRGKSWATLRDGFTQTEYTPHWTACWPAALVGLYLLYQVSSRPDTTTPCNTTYSKNSHWFI